jgi:hypothetical protein
MEELLESLLTAALGLTLESRIEEVSQLPEVQIRLNPPLESARVCAAWHITEGRVTICATHHHEHSRRVKAPVPRMVDSSARRLVARRIQWPQQLGDLRSNEVSRGAP